MSVSNLWNISSTVWELQKKVIDEELLKPDNSQKINKALNGYKKLSNYFEALWGNIHSKYNQEFPESYVKTMEENIASIQKAIQSIPIYNETTRLSIVEKLNNINKLAVQLEMRLNFIQRPIQV